MFSAAITSPARGRKIWEIVSCECVQQVLGFGYEQLVSRLRSRRTRSNGALLAANELREMRSTWGKETIGNEEAGRLAEITEGTTSMHSKVPPISAVNVLCPGPLSVCRLINGKLGSEPVVFNGRFWRWPWEKKLWRKSLMESPPPFSLLSIANRERGEHAWNLQ